MTPPDVGRPDEVPLPAGRMTQGIARRGGQLLRPMGPWSAAIHEYLRHLESVGFRGAPRLLGVEGELVGGAALARAQGRFRA